AAAVTTKLKIGTGVCLVIQRDTIQTAKIVASLDQASKGRFLFGIGGGWNQDEMEDHGTVYATRFKKMREQIEAMKKIWTESKPEYHGEIVDFPPMMTWPKPVQKPHPPVIIGGAFGKPEDFLPPFKQMLSEAGRTIAEVPVSMFGLQPDLDLVKRYQDLGI